MKMDLSGRIDELWAYVFVGPDGQESLPLTPIVARTAYELAKNAGTADPGNLANMAGRTMRLVKFHSRSLVMEIKPDASRPERSEIAGGGTVGGAE